MNEIIKVNYDNERPTTSARDLWEFLNKPYDKFTKWFDQYKEYGFNQDEDYRLLCIKVHTNNPKNPQADATDYEITVDMAKELSMLQRSEKGKMARKYFIELEKQWNNPETIMARAIKMANNKIHQLEQHIEITKPKVIFADAVTASKSSVLIGEMAKILKQNGIDVGQNRLFDWMRANGYLCKAGENYNLPTQYAMDLKLFEIKKNTIINPDGSSRVTRTPKVTGKGQVYFVNKFMTRELN